MVGVLQPALDAADPPDVVHAAGAVHAAHAADPPDAVPAAHVVGAPAALDDEP